MRELIYGVIIVHQHVKEKASKNMAKTMDIYVKQYNHMNSKQETDDLVINSVINVIRIPKRRNAGGSVVWVGVAQTLMPSYN